MYIASIHTELHALSTSSADQLVIREGFRKQAMTASKAVGVAHLIQDRDGNWTLRPDHTTGKVPSRSDFIDKFGKNCDATLQRNAIQIESFLGLSAIFAPIQSVGRPEVLLLLTKDASPQVLFLVEVICEYLASWLRDRSSHDDRWKLVSLAALVELVSKIESKATVAEAGQVIANELVRHLPCDHVAVGAVKSGRIRMLAISGTDELKANSEAYQQNETALNECWIRNELGCWPSEEKANRHLLLAHRQLAQANNYQSVTSLPIETPEEEVVGAVLLAGTNLPPDDPRLTNFVRAAAPRLASALAVVDRAEKSKLWQSLDYCIQQMRTRKGRLWGGVLAAIACIMMVPFPYRIRCSCVLDATERRYAVAPFDGIVKKGHVEPGDLVKSGALLASMDGQQLRYRMASVAADLAKAKKQSDIDLTKGDIPASLVAKLEAESLDAEKTQLEIREKRIEISSPIDGMVLSGSLEHAQGASVTTGQVLYEIGPLDRLTIEVPIPADEIGHVEVGQKVRVWVKGFESKPLVATIEKIAPRSELREAMNVFVAEATIDNPGSRYRPGMKGRVRIDAASHTLAWNLFHKPWGYLVSRFTWW